MIQCRVSIVRVFFSSNFQVDKNSERPSSLNLNRVKNDPKMSHIKFSLRTLDLQKIGVGRP